MSIQRYFKKIKQAQANRKGRNFVPGVFDLRVTDVDFKVSENPDTEGDTFLIVNFEVLNFRDCEYYNHETQETESTAGCFKPGDDVSFRRNLDKRGGPAAAKDLALALLCALDEDCDLTEAEISVMLDDDQDTSFSDAFEAGELTGLEICNIVQCVKTSKGNNYFTSKWKARNRMH